MYLKNNKTLFWCNTMTINKKIFSKKRIGYSLIVFMFLTIPIYYFKLKNDTKSSIVPNQRYEIMKRDIIGKYIKSLPRIINEKTTNSKILVFLYMGSDCGNCMKNGFRITQKIDSLFNTQIVKVIANNSNISRDHILFNYNNFIYSDDKSLIRQELRYLYTPVFLVLDSNYKILESKFLQLEDTQEEEDNFISLLRTLLLNNT